MYLITDTINRMQQLKFLYNAQDLKPHEINMLYPDTFTGLRSIYTYACELKNEICDVNTATTGVYILNIYIEHTCVSHSK